MRTALGAFCATVYLASAAFAATGDSPATDHPWMTGAPPAATNLVTRANWLVAPYIDWSFQHVEALVPTTTVDRGAGPVSALDSVPADLASLRFTDFAGKTHTFAQFVDEMHVDALVLYAGGKIRQEIYRNAQTSRTRHLVWSVTKSFTGLVAEMLIAQGKLDETKRVTDYVPELAGGAYDGATLRNLLNMEIGIDFTEVYDDPNSTITQFGYASGFQIAPPGVKTYASLYDFLPTLQRKGEHGRDFHYVTANSEVLGWVVEKVTGKGFAQVFDEMVYGKIGAERDAFYATDPHGKAISGGGLNVTARDALRLGVMMAQGGRFNGQQIVPAAVVAKIAAGSTPRPSLWGNENGGKDHSYVSQWYVEHSHGVVSAEGINGQTIHFQPKTGVVMAVQSSYPQADGPFFGVIDDFFYAVADKLAKKP